VGVSVKEEQHRPKRPNGTPAAKGCGASRFRFLKKHHVLKNIHADQLLLRVAPFSRPF
jgi:hypothetical protein